MKLRLAKLLGILLAQTALSSAYAALSVSGTPATGTTVVGSTVAVTLTTANTNDIILVCSGNQNNQFISSIADTSLLSWSKVISVQANTLTTELWYAVASGILSSDVITVTYGGTPVSRLIAWGVSGANTGTPFDANASLPASKATTSTTSNTIPYSTTALNTMIVSCAKSQATGFGTLTPPSGTTPLLAFTSMSADEKIVSAAQSGVNSVYSYTNTINVDQVLTAVQQAGSPPPPSAATGAILGGPF